MAQFDDLGVEEAGDSNSNSNSKPSSEKQSKSQEQPKPEDDLLDELGNLATQRASRPATPRLSTDARGSKRTSTATPPPERSSGDKGPAPRKSNDGSKATLTPSESQASDAGQASSQSQSPEEESSQAGAGGGWWGGIFATASAAVKQAEAAVKEIQKNEEAQKWAEQVKGNVGALKGLGIVYLVTYSILDLNH